MPMITGLTPYVEVFDMMASIAFYRDILGFHVLFASAEVETLEGRFSHFVRLGRGHGQIMLNTAYDSNDRPPGRSEARWAGCRYIQFYLDCDDVHGLYAEVIARGSDATAPVPTGYGYLAFSVSDPDGYRIIFHQPA